MTNDEKAKILDAIIANHDAIIYWMATAAEYNCTCDSSVGHFCEECALKSLVTHLNAVGSLYANLATDNNATGVLPGLDGSANCQHGAD